MADIIQIKRGTAAYWASVNPILASGEPALETDTRKEKIGDGVTAWNSLAYRITGTASASSLSIKKHPDNSGAGVEENDLVEVYLNDGSNDYLVLLKYTNALADNDTENYGTGPDFEDGNYEWIKTEYSN